jgi:hypothetical protein
MGVTLDAVIDRLYRDYLYPPDEQPAQTRLNGNHDAAVTTIALTDNVLEPEEEASIGAGTLLECNQELWRVTSVSWPNVNVIRGVAGTTEAAHTSGDTVIVRPKYNRAGVFESVCDAIEDLGTDLFSVVTSATFTTTLALIEVPAAVDKILKCAYRAYDSAVSTTRYIPAAVELLKDQPTAVSSTGQAIQLHGTPTGRTAYYVYRAKFARPADETYDLTDDAPGFETRWIPLILMNALIDLLAGADLGARTVEYLTEALEAEGFPAGSGESIDRALVRIYEYRLGKAVKALNRDHPIRVEQAQVVYGGG